MKRNNSSVVHVAHLGSLINVDYTGGVITMCIISFHVHEHPTYKLVVIANRDEQYKRSTAQAHFWEDEPDILAGRDLEAMGTWMGITKQGRFAALTNYRNP